MGIISHVSFNHVLALKLPFLVGEGDITKKKQ